MSVLVIGRNGRALMPTNPRKARLLLKKKTASVVCRHPFIIQLLYKTGCATQEGCIGIDTGSQHIGVGITCGDRVILKGDIIRNACILKKQTAEDSIGEK